jgi:hypothetical protein
VEVPIGAGLNRELVENRDKIERAEIDLDKFISHRSRQLEQDEHRRREEEAWRESCRKEEIKRREARRHEWIEFHKQRIDGLEATLIQLIEFHEDELQKYLQKGA